MGKPYGSTPRAFDKDIRTLLAASDASIRAYVARDSVKNRATFHEAVRDFKSSGHDSSVTRLKVFWVPYDFDADDESARTLVSRHLTAMIAEDILFNIVFGRLSASAVRAIVISSGMMALETAVLHHIATEGFFNYSDLRNQFEASPSTLRDRVSRLQLSRLLLQPRDGGQCYYVNPAGRAYLRLCAQMYHLIFDEVKLTTETCEVLRLLHMEPDPDVRENLKYGGDWLGGRTPGVVFQLFVTRSVAAAAQWNINWNNMAFTAYADELDQHKWLQI
jgi:hypothetical protein